MSGAGVQTSVLENVRVLDFGRYIAAPFCAALLADLGAEVIRVESAAGAPDRYVMPISEGGDGALYMQMNRNKRSLALDFACERGQRVFRKLVASSDVVVVNLPPKVLARLGLDYASLCGIKADIILTTITAYGYEGAERDTTGFDGTGQALSGAIHLTGHGAPPFRAAGSYVDYATGIAAAYATLAALLTKAQIGHGQHVQASLLCTALTIMNPMLIEEASGARSRTPTGNRSPIAGPSDLFLTQDRWIMVQVIGNQMFARWAKLVGAEEFLSDSRFADDIRRGENGEILSARMAEWCAIRSSAECLAALREARVPGCLVLSPAEAVTAPQNAGGGFFQWQFYPELDEPVPVVVPLTRMSKNGERREHRKAPPLGQDTETILSSLQYSADEIRELEEANVVGQAFVN